MDPVIDASELASRLHEPGLRVIDCRFSLAQPDEGPHAYRTAHIPGAVYLHLERELSGPVGPHGGRHPLPDPAGLARRLGEIGIGTDNPVVVYDDHGDMASRCWWLLTWMGHPAVRVLDGGMAAWRDLGGPLTSEVPHHPHAHFAVKLRPELLVTQRAEVEAAAAKGLLVDSRAGARYRGDVEPLDKKAGHIPGARNCDWQRVMGPSGRLRPASDLAQRFATLGGRDPVVYCGSGVTACANILAMTRLGLTPRLYAGSWSDWITYPDRPIATGPEHPDPEDEFA
jgi:thiosulfate/3-mercaptopyruvate sulfurtransferase